MATSDAFLGTAVEPASVLCLIRDLLPDVAGVDADGSRSTAELTGSGVESSNEASREEAGELLWDLSSYEANAQLMLVRKWSS